MGIIELIVIIVVAVIAFLYNGGRQRLFGIYNTRYGFLDDYDTMDYDPLEDIRQSYNDRLQDYYQQNAPRMYLINKYCEARLIKENNGDIWFYVKGRTVDNLIGAYFEVKGDSTHASTMWAMIDMEFKSHTDFNAIKDLYFKLNHTVDTIGGLEYFYQPTRGGLPKPTINKMAQNEFCRMEIQTLSGGEKVLVCSEIWGEQNWDKPRKFVIKGDKPVLYGILAEFAKNPNKELNYLEVLYQNIKRNDCIVEELADNLNLSSQNENMKQKEPEPIKYIHVDLDNQKDFSTKENNEKSNISALVDLDNIPKSEDFPTETHKDNTAGKNIKKYDERHLDL